MDKDLPSTWKKYREGLCNTCWAGCCTMPVEVMLSDLIRLELITDDEAGGSLKKVAAKLERAGILKNYRASTGLFMLSQQSDDRCVFLDKNRRCTVYDKRPEVCRKFPSIGPRPGFCPAKNKS